MVEYPQGWLSSLLDGETAALAVWRMDPKVAGAAGCMGDIGTHAENLARYVTGLEIEELCADLTGFIPGNKLDDDGSVLIRYKGGARGILYASQISAGEENGINIRVYGNKAGLYWNQENPNYVWIRSREGTETRYSRGNANLGDAAKGQLAAAHGPPRRLLRGVRERVPRSVQGDQRGGLGREGPAVRLPDGRRRRASGWPLSKPWSRARSRARSGRSSRPRSSRARSVPSAMSRRPNIVIFNPDQFRADAVAHLGNPASSTPVLDRLAREDAVSFRWAFCQNPVCTPSRCSFMTGLVPARPRPPHDVPHAAARRADPAREPHARRLPRLVGRQERPRAGPARLGPLLSRTAAPPGRACGRTCTREQGWRGEPGGDNWYSFFAGRLQTDQGEPYRDGDWDVVEQAADWVRGYRREEPFCLFLSLGTPHPPYGVEEPWYGAVDRRRVPARVRTPASWERLPSIMKGLVEGQGLEGWTEDAMDRSARDVPRHVRPRRSSPRARDRGAQGAGHL